MTVACPECGAVQDIPRLNRSATAECFRCDTALERTAGRSAGAALACALAALGLFFPGNMLPAMRSQLLGAAVEARAIDGISAFYDAGWPVMAAFVAMFVMVLPMARAAMLVAVLGALGLGYRQLWQGRLFRLAEALRGWSMAHVYLAAGAVTYSRVAAQLDITLLAGGWCFVGAVVFLMIAEASLDRRRIWNALRPEARVPPGMPVISCIGCQLVLPADREGRPCPRCDRRLHVRRASSVEHTVALTAAATVLLYPAYFLPMVISVQPNGVVERTIMDGVDELFGRGFWYLGIIVFVVSIGIPLTKLLVLFWLALSVRFPHRRLLRMRTRLHRIVDEINPWSFLDPFIVALNASMLAYPGIVDVRPAPGVLAFSLVVVLTMVASRLFDARLMWDAVERKAPLEAR